jgi:hypothetical protein
MVVKTFRGILQTGTQDRIKLSTIKGKMGYRIVKFQIIDDDPGEQTPEITVKIYKTKQSTIDNAVNFSDTDLLAVAYYRSTSNVSGDSHNIIFDQEIVNQDIYVTAICLNDNRPSNYYIELEVIPLDDKMAEYATVKDLRTRGF